MAQEWYYHSGGRRVGPISSATLKKLADTGQLALTDVVWRQGLAGWVPASQVKGLFVSPPELPLTLKQDGKQQAFSKSMDVGTVLSSPASTDDSMKHPLVAFSDMTVMGIHVQRIALAVAALLGGASAVMPWSADDGKVSYAWQIGGWWLHLLFAVPLVVAWLGDWSKAIKGTILIPAVMAPTLAALVAIALMLERNVFILQVMAEGKDNLLVSSKLLINDTEKMLTPGTPTLTVEDAVAQVTAVKTGLGAYVLLAAAITCVGVFYTVSQVSRKFLLWGGPRSAASQHD